MAVKKGLGKGLDSLIADKVSTKQMAKTETPTKLKSEHAADAVMMEITKVEPNRDQPRQKFDEDACWNWRNLLNSLVCYSLY